jgi:ankyrin repeat protein
MSESETERQLLEALAAGADVNAPVNSWGNKPLERAAAEGSKCLVSLLLDAGARVDESCALHAAAHMGRADVCSLLLARGASLTHTNARGLTAFDVARTSLQSNQDAVRACRPKGAAGRTLHVAAIVGDTALASELLEQGSDVDAYDGRTGKTPLIEAAERGHVDMCRLLLAAGADLERGTQVNGRQPLALAVRAGQKDVVLALLEGCSDGQVAAAFYECHLRKRYGLAEAIADRIDEPSRLYSGARSRLDATLRNGNERVYRSLHNRGVTLPLWAAAAVGDTNAIRKAIAARADLNETGLDSWAETPLYTAVRNARHDAAKLLVAAGADVNRVSVKRRGNTALIEAVEAGNAELASLLLKAGADVNTANGAGRTALYMAVWKGHERILEMLIEAGATANEIPALRREGDDPVPLSKVAQKREIVRLLRRHGLE